MNLCIDIGNSRIKWAVFDEEGMVHYDVFERNFESKLKEVQSEFPITKSMSSSTRKRASSMESLAASYFDHSLLTHETKVPFTNTYTTPATLGRDRIAGVVGAWSRYRDQASMVIDAGTCITYDIVDNKGVYLGGNISPGVTMRLEAMHHFTDGLPLVDKKLPVSDIGDSTTTAIQNGAVRGTIMELESFIATISVRLNKLNVILTGGDAQFFGDVINTEIFVHPHLVLEGLNEILNYNA